MQELIEKLNFEIFRNPQNYTRPPSEYLEIFNTLTEQLHHLQIKKQILDQSTKQHKMLTASATSSSTLQQQQQQQTINNNNNNNNKFTSNREKDTSSWDGGCNDSTPSTSANACADANMPPRVPKLNHPTTLATTTSTSSSSMTPAAAYANNSKRPSNPQIMAWQSPSPATTATHTHTHSRSVSSSYSSPFPPPTISSFSTSANAAAGAGGVDHYSSPPLSQPPPSLSPKSQAALTGTCFPMNINKKNDVTANQRMKKKTVEIWVIDIGVYIALFFVFVQMHKLHSHRTCNNTNSISKWRTTAARSSTSTRRPQSLDNHRLRRNPRTAFRRRRPSRRPLLPRRPRRRPFYAFTLEAAPQW